MTADEVVAALDRLDPSDPEAAHSEADALCVSLLPEEVQKARARLVLRCDWWATA